MSDGPNDLISDLLSDLLAVATRLTQAGLSVLPIDYRTKTPVARLLPKGQDRRFTWLPFRKQIADAATLQRWFDGSVQSLAVVGGAVSGGLLVFDFDVEGFYEAWRAMLAGEQVDNLPVQRTGGGGYQVFCRCAQTHGNLKLAWAPSQQETSGREIAIETRGEGGYAIAPPSLHPSGGRYTMHKGALWEIPTLEPQQVSRLLEAARALDQAPLTRPELKQVLAQNSRTNAPRRASDDRVGPGVIDQFNASHPIEMMLDHHGYVQRGARWVRPGGRSASVSVIDGRSFHFSSNDSLNDGKVRAGMGVHDAFDLYCHCEHGNDVAAAVKAAAKSMNVGPLQGRHNPRCRVNRSDITPDLGSSDGVWSMSARRCEMKGVAEAPLFVPFPTPLLPEPLASYIRQSAAAIGCDESCVALPLLVGLSIAVGSTRRVAITPDWTEYPVLWAAIIASSGQRKSPGLDAALRPLRELQQQLFQQHKAATDLYRKQLEERKSAAKAKACSDVPIRPVQKRLLVNDTTIEALAFILEDNPRGVGVVRDELSGWLASFNQYKSGRGADEAQWLELYRGGYLTVDRKTGERPTTFVPRATVSITGTIQPGVIRRLCGRERFENGLVARMLFAMPPRKPRRWSDARVAPAVQEQLKGLYAQLYGLQFDAEGEPVDLPLSASAQKVFKKFVDDHGAEQDLLHDDRLEAAFAKLEGYAARLGLIVHLARHAMSEGSEASEGNELDGSVGSVGAVEAVGAVVDEQSLEVGIALARWFGGEAKRVYAQLDEGKIQSPKENLLNLIHRYGGSISTRELTRHNHRYPTSESARLALDAMVKDGLGHWVDLKPGVHGGRPRRVFQSLTDSADTDQTPVLSPPVGVMPCIPVQSSGSVDVSEATAADSDAHSEKTFIDTSALGGAHPQRTVALSPSLTRDLKRNGSS